MRIFKYLLIAGAGMLMVGTGLCSAVTLPMIVSAGGAAWLLLNLLGWGIAVGMFFFIRFMRRN